MPSKPKTFRPGHLSKETVRRSYERTDSRAEDRSFYKSGPWRRLRAAFLAEHPLCVDCRKTGRLTPAEHVHHLLERKDRPDLALEWDNLQALCPPCHNRKRGT